LRGEFSRLRIDGRELGRKEIAPFRMYGVEGNAGFGVGNGAGRNSANGAQK
jgi:hypothetical protein